MKGEKLLDAMDYLPEALLEQTDKLRQKKKIRWQNWAALAACLCLAAGCFLLSPSTASKNEAAPDSANGKGENFAESTTARYVLAEVNAVQPQQLKVTLLAEEYGGRQIFLDVGKLTDIPALTSGDRIRIYFGDKLLADSEEWLGDVVSPIKIEIQEE